MARIATEWRSLRTSILEHKVSLGFSLRVTLAAVSSFTLSHLLHVPLPLWTVLTSVILTQVSFGRSVTAALEQMMVSALCAFCMKNFVMLRAGLAARS
jgi:hypothetical protein